MTGKTPDEYVAAVRERGLTIYDRIEVGDPDLWIPAEELELILDRELYGKSLAGLPLRTRSKVAKELVCKALGYPAPGSFTKTQPRFPGQKFDTYVQKSNNLQIWNEELAPSRRYVIIRLDGEDVIRKVRVVTGDTLAELDTTGTLTQKYQARVIPGKAEAELIAEEDTEPIRGLVRPHLDPSSSMSPVDYPEPGMILPIADLFERLRPLVGTKFPDAGRDQERIRGAALHEIVCGALGYSDYRDHGQFPDVRHQLLEVKLQTSPTIDLGLVCPDSTEPLDTPMIGERQLRHCDVRYGLFCGETDGEDVTLSHFFLTTGEKFFGRFPQFQGKILNKKLQIPLPADFFED